MSIRAVKGFLVSAIPAAMLLAGPAPAADQAVLTQHVLSERTEVEAAQAAIDYCAARGRHVHVVIVDPYGDLMLLIVGDGAKYNTVESAERKAYTSAMMGTSTLKIAQAIAANPHMQLPPDSRMLFLGGGTPIRVGSEIVGAIGVGGGSPAQDQECADAGVAKVQPVLH